MSQINPFFKTKVNLRQFKANAYAELGGKVWRVGIMNNQYLKESDYDAPLVRVLGGKANKMGRKTWKDINGKRRHIWASFKSFYFNTELEQGFFKLLSRSMDRVFKGFWRNENDRRISNGIRSIMIQGYLEQTKTRVNKLGRVMQKGFARYGIGTGETIRSIIAKRDMDDVFKSNVRRKQPSEFYKQNFKETFEIDYQG